MPHIEAVYFSVRTDKDTREESVVEVTSDKRSEVNGQVVDGGLRDPRFGPLGSKNICATCNERRCTGHFGHIELCVPMYNVLWSRQIIQWLKCVCRNCCNILIKDVGAAAELPRIKQLSHFSANVHSRCPRCKATSRKYQWKKETQQIMYELSGDNFVYDIDDVVEHLEMIPDYYIEELKMSHPKHMIMTALPVPPTSVRQPPQMGGRKLGEDDLTYRLRKIAYKNTALRSLINDNRPDHVVKEATIELQRLISSYFDQNKVETTGGTSTKVQYDSLAKKMKGKTGRIRGNLTGKRVNKSARAVVTAGHLPLGRVGVPEKIAKTLTKRITVTSYNMKTLKEMLNKEDSIIKFAIRPNGTKLDLSFMNRKHVELKVGWFIERELIDGDFVLFNRQPTLHKYGLMCHEVQVMEGNTFRLNLSCTPPYNADFDGDEMNLHVPQDVQSQAEASIIMHVEQNVVSVQNNKPVMSIVQDTLIGAYLLTAPGVSIKAVDFFACVMTIEDWDGDIESKKEYTGHELVSMTLPLVNWDGAGCKILGGKLLYGQLTKKVLGSSHQSLIHVIHNDCGSREAARFMYRFQCVVREWLSRRGFSMSVSDIVCEENSYIREQCERAYEDVKDMTSESSINARLNAARDLVGVAVQKPLRKDNQLFCMVDCGSKGSFTNISQIMGVVGQQNMEGKRIGNCWSNRTLPHFPRGCSTPQSKGFIDRNYVQGLTPAQQWFHAVSGREGVIDTACKTAQTGYTGRKLIKSIENLVARRDGSVRNADGGVIQFKYGDDGFDPLHVERQEIDDLDPMISSFIPSEEYVQLEADCEYLKRIDAFRDPIHANTTKWMLPIPVDRIVQNAMTIFNVTISDRIDQGTIYESISELVETISNDLLKILLRNRLNSYRLYHQLEITEDQLEKVIHDIKYQYERLSVDTGDAVGANAAQSIGEPATQMTLNSVEYDTNLIIRWNQASQNACIGETIDTLLEKYKHHIQFPTPETAYLALDNGVAEALTVDDDGNVSWKTLEAVTRHPPNNKDGSSTLVKITTRSGRTVTATKAKSFLVVEQGKVVTKEGSALTVGDEIPVLRTLPKEDRTEVDLNMYLDPKQYIFTTTMERAYSTMRKTARRTGPQSWFGPFLNLLPYSRSDSCRVALEKFVHFRIPGFVYTKKHNKITKGIPEKIILNSSFGFFVGAYLAEGCCTEHQIHIANNCPTYRQRAAEWPSLWGIQNHVTNEKDRIKNNGVSISVMFHSTLLSTLMKTWCNQGSWNKRVPPFAYSAPRSFIIGLLEGYLSGDGTVHKNGSMNASSRSKALIEGISLLLTRLEIPSTLGNDMVMGSLQHRLYITIRDAQKLHAQMTLCVPMKEQRLEHVSQEKKRRKKFKKKSTLNDVFIDPVVKIEEVVSEHPYVYDLTVAETRNMVTASGLTQRDTFHHAGNSSKNVTLGIPRLRECIDCVENINEPLTTFPCDDPKFITHSLHHVTLDEIVEHSSMEVIPGEMESFHLFPDPEYKPAKDKVLVLYLKDWYDVLTVKNKLCAYGLHCAYTEGPNPIFHIHGRRNIQAFYESTLRKCSLRGVKGTTFVDVTKEDVGYSVATDLTDMSELWKLGIPANEIKTNDVQKVVKLLGIEAGRRTLVIEIRKILSYYGLYVNARHVLVLVDWMTFTGNMVPTTRHGMKKVFSSPLQRATFEEVIDVVTNAAAFNEVDHLKGVSQRIVVGAPAVIGTNISLDILKDEVVEHKYAQPKPLEMVQLSSAWVQEENPWAVDDTFDQHTFFQPQQQTFFGAAQPGVPGLSAFGAAPFGGLNAFGWQHGSATQVPVFPSLPQAASVPEAPMDLGYDDYGQMYDPEFRPTSPAYDPNRPDSPVYDPNRPTSPAYDPNRPDSPAYDPLSYGADCYDPDTAKSEPNFPNQSSLVQTSQLQDPQKKRQRTFF
jgi:DNA-directed RNA polymerase beta' subunit